MKARYTRELLRDNGRVRSRTLPARRDGPRRCQERGKTETATNTPIFLAVGHTRLSFRARSFGENRTGEPLGWSPAFRAEVGWQTGGTSEWERAYNDPALGAVFYVDDYGEKLGTPSDRVHLLLVALRRHRRSRVLVHRLGARHAVELRAFRPHREPLNDPVGAKAAVCFEMGLYLR